MDDLDRDGKGRFCYTESSLMGDNGTFETGQLNDL